MATAMVKNKPDTKNGNKDPLSIKIKIRNTTRGVENIAILHSTPVDPNQSEEDIDSNTKSNSFDADVQSANLDDYSNSEKERHSNFHPKGRNNFERGLRNFETNSKCISPLRRIEKTMSNFKCY